MSQEVLAAPEFTKSYVSAVERGKARPSLKALELMSRRLEIPMSELLAAVPPAAGVPDLVSIASTVTYTLDRAEILIQQHQAGPALQHLNDITQQYQAHFEDLNPYLVYKLHYLRGLAHLRLDEPAPARHELNTALQLAGQLDDSTEDVERVRDAVGLAFYQQGMARLALEQHEQCLEAVRNGTVKDIGLRLSIGRNLANDYAALNDPEQARRSYNDALGLLSAVATLEQQAESYWTLSEGYRQDNDRSHAQRYATRALNIYQAADNLATAAQLNIHLAGILIGREEYAEAERLLARARTLLQASGNSVLLSTVYEEYAALALQQKDLEAAAGYAEQALMLIEQMPEQAQADAQTTANRVRAHARALRLAGLVQEQQGHPAEADRLFGRALALANASTATDAATDLELTYADLLVARGSHEQAALHYRAAFQHRQRQAPR